MAYRNTEEKILMFNAINKFKLGNSVGISKIINFLNTVKGLYSNKVFLNYQVSQFAGGKIKTKISLLYIKLIWIL